MIKSKRHKIHFGKNDPHHSYAFKYFSFKSYSIVDDGN